MLKPYLFLLLFFCLLFSEEILAQGLIPYRKGKLWGYADSNAKIVIEPKYDQVDQWHSPCDVMAVKLGDYWGVINTKGDIVIPIIHKSVVANCPDRSGGIIIIRDNDTNGIQLFSHHGKAIANVKEIDSYGNAYLGPNLFVNNNGNGLISGSGKWLVKPQSAWIFLGDEGFYTMTTDSTRIYNPEGKCIFTTRPLRYHLYYKEGYLSFYYEVKDWERLPKIKEKDLLPKVYDWETQKYRKQTPEEVITYTVHCLIDRKGKNLIPPGFSTQWRKPENGYLLVSGKLGQAIIDTNGKFLVKERPGAIDYYGNYMIVSNGFVIPSNWRLVPTKNTQIQSFNGTVFKVRVNNTFNFMDTSGKILYTKGFDWITDEKNKCAFAKKHGKYYWMDEKGKTIIEKDSTQIEYGMPYDEDLAIVYMNGKGGLMDKQGKLVQPTVYGNISYMRAGFYWVSTPSGVGVIKDGKLIIDTIHSSMNITADNQQVILSKNFLWGLYNLKGEELLPKVYSKIEQNQLGYFALEKPNPEFMAANVYGSLDSYGLPRREVFQEIKVPAYLCYMADKEGKLIKGLEGYFLYRPFNQTILQTDSGWIRLDGLKFFEEE
ncbi:MAG: WG repeat-containing protein [Bacteroidota bacterium]